MKKMFLTAVAMLCGMAVMAEALWDGDLSSVTLQSGNKLQDVSVKTEDGALLITGTTEGNSVTYINVEIRVKPFVLGNRSISMEFCSDDPKTTETLYVRAQNAKRKSIMSFQRWGCPLTETFRKFVFIPGTSYPSMKWEAAVATAPVTDPIDRILIFIGARGDGKPISVKVKNISVSDEAKNPFPMRPGQLLESPSNDCLSRVVKNGDTVYIDGIPQTNIVTYIYGQVPFTGDLTGKKLVMTASTATPAVTDALYIRGYNAKRQCILSFRSWGHILKNGPKTLTLTPGQNSSGLQWEPDRVKPGLDQNLTKLELIIGTNKNMHKLMSAEFKDIKIQ